LHTVALPATQPLLTQASPTVHGLPSLHGELFAACVHPVLLLHPSELHKLLSSQFIAAPGWHTRPEHASPTVHTLLSASHGLPLLTAVGPHLPVPGAHVFWLHAVSAVASHVTTVLGLTVHL